MTRTEIRDLCALAERLLAGGNHGVLSTLFSVSGSSYRPLGSMMLSAYGASYLAGGISGGCLEDYVARQGHALTTSSPAAVLRFSTDPDDAVEGVPTPGCGGEIKVLVEKLTPDHLPFLVWYGAAQNRDTLSVGLCILEKMNDRWSVSRSFDEKKPQVPRDRSLETVRREALSLRQCCSAALSASREALAYYVRPLPRLVILGAREGARPLCEMARALDWHVTVADRRARLATPKRFPHADVVLQDSWWQVMKRITFTPHTAVVVMTHSVEDDAEILPLLRDKPFAYAGILGPARRKERVLADAGLGSDSALPRRLRGPLGLDLGERSAAGIAVSIIAEILTVLNARDGDALSDPGHGLTTHLTPVETSTCLSC